MGKKKDYPVKPWGSKTPAWFFKKGKTQARKDAAHGLKVHRHENEMPSSWWDGYESYASNK